VSEASGGGPEDLPAGVIEIGRGADGFWRWTYGESTDRQWLRSNRSYPTRGEALHAAALAYPGAPVTEPRDLDPWLLRRAWLVIVASILSGGLALLVAGVIAAGRLAIRLGWRALRRRTRPR
jgi:hypothetical protein